VAFSKIAIKNRETLCESRIDAATNFLSLVSNKEKGELKYQTVEIDKNWSPATIQTGRN
jgi:hypothetical protein